MNQIIVCQSIAALNAYTEVLSYLPFGYLCMLELTNEQKCYLKGITSATLGIADAKPAF